MLKRVAQHRVSAADLTRTAAKSGARTIRMVINNPRVSLS